MILGVLLYFVTVSGLVALVWNFVRNLREERFAAMPDWDTLPLHAEPPPTCPLCRRPLMRSSDATSGGAVLGTSTRWLCPVHGSFVFNKEAA